MTDTALRAPDLLPGRPDLLVQAPATGLSPGVLTGLVVAVVLVVLLIVLVVGLVLARRRRISLREKEEAERAKPAKGSYTAGTGFSFSAGGGAATKERPAVPEPEPEQAAAAPVETPPVVQTPPLVEPPPVEPRPVETPPAVETPPVETPPVETPAAEPAHAEPASTDAPPVAGPTATPEAPPATGSPAFVEPPPVVEPPSVEPAPVEPVAPAPSQPAPADAQPATTDASLAPSEPIASPEGRLERLRGRLGRSRSTLGTGLLGLLGAGDLDEDSWEEVEDQLLMADLGSATTQEVVGKLRERIAARGVRTSDEVRDLLREVLVETLGTGLERSVRALAHDGRPAVVLVVGVNGTGKTTTTGKLARVLVGGGHEIVLGAADTFRAAAAEQLETWGERAGARTVRGAEGADPASVAFDAVKKGTEAGVDAVLLDTAGRLHTKTGLMDELGKVKRVVERQAEVDEVLLVLDATTGQNGLTQARVFGEVVDVTGVVLTKLDGTAKGGIVFQVQRELGVPVKLVGLGEGPDDLAPFEPEAFVDALLR